MVYLDRIGVARPKRLLALDGGGIRGVLTLEILSEMEDLLRRELGRDDSFVLADYFDYIGGTSSGAVIAAGLALGLPVNDIRVLYATRGAEMFDKAAFIASSDTSTTATDWKAC